MDRSYKAELIDRICTRLQAALIDDVPVDDDARADRVSKSKDVDDPEGIVVSVHSVYPLGPNDSNRDMLFQGVNGGNKFGWNFPPESIGGSVFRRVAGSIQVRAILDGKTPEEAIDIIDMVQTRIEYALDNDSGHELWPFTDDLGYTVSNLISSGRTGYASGGEDTAVDAHWVDWIALVSYQRTN